MNKDNEVDEKVMPEPLTYGLRRKGETAVIGLIPPKVHANPPKVPEYLRDYEEVPLYSATTVAELRAEVAEQSAMAHKWKALHDAVSLAHEVQAKSITRALDRADAAERRVGELERLRAETYQVVSVLLSDTGQFDSDHGQKILDNLSEARIVHEDVLPWAAITGADQT